MANILSGLKAIILERFKPASYGPMILVFTLVNGLFYLKISGSNTANIILAIVVMLSAFFRLRLFDEIKDYHVDLKINPTRPLARGAITIDQVKLVIALLILFELIAVTSFIGINALFIHLVSVSYSLLMYEEFFIGKWLRPHLTTYAVTHTFVSVIMGISAGFLMAKGITHELSGKEFLFFLGNWFYFNLFEFARKSFSLDEERMGVDTYSSLFKPVGAGALSFSQAILGYIVWSSYYLVHIKIISFVLIDIYAVITLIYIFKTTKLSANLFRNFSGLFLILQYALTIWNFWS